MSLSGVIQKIENGTIQEKDLIEMLKDINYQANSPDRKVAESFISSIMEGKIAQNKDVSRVQAKAMHYMLTKIELADRNIEVSDVKYAESNPTTRAYYNPNDNSLTFNENVIFSPRILNQSSYFVNRKLLVVENYLKNISHEIQHVAQKKGLNKILEDPSLMTDKSYILARESILFERKANDIYDNDKDNLIYNGINHDDFLIEIDANNVGWKGALKGLKKHSPTIYQEQKEKIQGHIEKTDEHLKQRDTTWSHHTNVGEENVKATFKNSMVIDKVMQNSDQSYRDYLFENFPGLDYVYRSNGSKKSFHEIAQEMIDKVNEIDRKYESKEILPGEKRAMKRDAVKMFMTIIETDPSLSLESCLMRISSIKPDGTKFYNYRTELDKKYEQLGVLNQTGMEQKTAMQEIDVCADKAVEIMKILEEQNFEVSRDMIEKYKRRIYQHSNDIKLIQYQEKAFKMIEDEFMKNSALSNANDEYKKGAPAREAANEKDQKDIVDSKNLLNSVFPNLKIKPQRAIGKGKDFVLETNLEQKFLLNESVASYYHDVRQFAKKQNKPVAELEGFVPIYKLNEAINKIYPGNISSDMQQQFQSKLDNGESSLYENSYSVLHQEESKVEQVSLDEIQKIREEESYGKEVDLGNGWTDKNGQFHEYIKHEQKPESNQEELELLENMQRQIN